MQGYLHYQVNHKVLVDKTAVRKQGREANKPGSVNLV